MSKRLRQLIEDQSKVKVIEHSHQDNSDLVWYATFAAIAASVFYFFAYYFGGTIWHALAGG